MAIDVDRIAYSSTDAESLKNRILESDDPFIITGVPLPGSEISDPKYLRDHYMDPDRRGLAWYNAPLPEPGEDIFNTPEAVREALLDPRSCVRPNPVRVWLQQAGHRTLMHYDGNSLTGLNLQVVGRKRWTLVSPHTPFPCAAFNKVAVIDENREINPSRYRVFEFETGPGDLLLLPRYWFHAVRTLEPVNININWVWTPVEPDFSSRIGRREAELLKLVRVMPRLQRFTFGSVKDYGGVEGSLVDRYIEPLTIIHAFKRLFLELASLPRTALRSRQILKLVRKFRQSNFNLGSEA